ncbi:peptidase domain protein [Haliangium ochraceum DSM 14365]|uniref:Serine protease n=2 Tax=Haliangium ochraceum TaxID=80816 RepID=D0LPC5_HALO1|nr:peptidase domain protein [Haliangium ochraceum DSM 14365]
MGASLATGCADVGPVGGDAVGTRQSPVVYGNDDRVEVFEYPDQSWADDVTGFTAALMRAEVVEISEQGLVTFDAPTLADEFGVCGDERFANQLTAAICSGTLIAPNLVLTAGHCVLDANACADIKLVFGYEMDGGESLRQATVDDVYACAELLVRRYTPAGEDYAIVRLDRPTGRETARLAPGGAVLADGARLVVHGNPSGLPTKIDDGGRVRDGRAATRDYFVANLDSFAGNSGSGVFDTASRELVGVLVRGEVDYVFDDSSGCYRVLACPDDGCRGEDVVYAGRAVDALCATGMVSPLCPCGDGVCDAGIGESTASCPLDCGSSCGDGACNGAEGPSNCSADCGTCGNASCDAGEDVDTCCTDCGCAAPLLCAANTCVPDPAAGDTCAEAAVLNPVGAYVVSGSTVDAVDDYRGECVLNSNAPERVYDITLAEETFIDAQVSGFDTILYVRGDCEDAVTEILCNDDAEPPGDGGSRLQGVFAPGTHYLFVDGRGTVSGAYQLALSFAPVRLASNDTCAAPSEIPASGTQVVTAALGALTGRDDYRGTCGGSGADHVYRFTTGARTGVTIKVEGIDSVLYLRSVCASSNAADELACNDDHPDAGFTGSLISVSDLPPGTYHVVVDAFSAGVAGDYTLTLAFDDCADTDADGVCDDRDGCPQDGAKTEPGACGCGVAEEDGDGDGAADCVDACPQDGAKTEPGACGCGVAEEDGDGDGAADCVDACPQDGAKTGPGACGCGVAEEDGDGDGAADCVDACPQDGAKTEPGACGCGSVEGGCQQDGAGGEGCAVGRADGRTGVPLVLILGWLALCVRRVRAERNVRKSDRVMSEKPIEGYPAPAR